ncbi:hypothetical protein KKC88_06330 [Patescibacteria group bacterium]|nr:hypothetical protein [Patescibacteria group bacterium]MBU1673901.1 hypothetical protein [Patescibacteria group bacterium]MBU1963426.1 hypothetical protein [Patescibacteria group bacterium]
MTNISDKINEQIKKNDIKPRPKWRYTFSEVLLWSLLIIGIPIIALAIALSWEITVQQDFRLFMAMPGRVLNMLRALPYFWLILSLALAILAFVEFRKTKQGYKIKWHFIVIVILIGTILLAALFYYTGLTQYIENKLEQHLPGYHRVVPVPHMIWMQPDAGTIAGIIGSVSSDSLILIDWNGDEWEVMFSRETMVPPELELLQGGKIRVIGERIDEDEIEAFGIRPWDKGKNKPFHPEQPNPRGKKLNIEIKEYQPSYY